MTADRCLKSKGHNHFITWLHCTSTNQYYTIEQKVHYSKVYKSPAKHNKIQQTVLKYSKLYYTIEWPIPPLVSGNNPQALLPVLSHYTTLHYTTLHYTTLQWLGILSACSHSGHQFVGQDDDTAALLVLMIIPHQFRAEGLIIVGLDQIFGISCCSFSPWSKSQGGVSGVRVGEARIPTNCPNTGDTPGKSRYKNALLISIQKQFWLECRFYCWTVLPWFTLSIWVCIFHLCCPGAVRAWEVGPYRLGLPGPPQHMRCNPS